MHLVSLEEIDELVAADEPETVAGNADALARLHLLIRRLDPPDDQVILLYLEEVDAASIGEITGLSARVLTAFCFWTAVWLAFSRASVRLQLQVERLDALKAE